MNKKIHSGIMLTLLLIGVFTVAFGVVTSQSVTTIGIGVYWDDNCIEPVTSVDWGSVKPGSSNNITVFVRNEGNVEVTLSLESSNWNPPEAASFVTLGWNYTGEILEESYVVPVTLSLYVSVSLEEISAVTFDENVRIEPINGLTGAISIHMAAFVSTTRSVDDDGPADFHTIQEAINAASDGDTIFVSSGTYYENVVVNKTVALVGEDRSTTFVDGNFLGTVISIESDNVNITGFTMQNSGWHPGGFDSWGILSTGAHHNIYHNIITNNLEGIRLAGWVPQSNVSGNIITNNYFGVVDWSWGAGNNIATNIITNNYYAGLELWCQRTTINGNNIIGNGHYGIYIGELENAVISENHIEKNDYGIIFEGNFFMENNVFFRNNLTKSSMCGVYLGIIGMGWAFNNIFYHNNFENNSLHAVDVFGNFWDHGYPSGGNYWESYTDVDHYRGPYQNETGSDGIWDHPYTVEVKDNYPLVNPWTSIEVPPVEEPEEYIEYVNETIQDLPDGIFNRTAEDVPDVKNDFSDLFNDTLENINEGNYVGAIEKLNMIKQNIYEEIVECAERQELISLIDDLIAYLETLL